MPCFAGGNTTLYYRFGSLRGRAGRGADTRPDAGNGSQLNVWMPLLRYGPGRHFLTIFSTRLRYWRYTSQPAELTLLERYTFPPAAMLHSSLVFVLKQNGARYKSMGDITVGISKAYGKIPNAQTHGFAQTT